VGHKGTCYGDNMRANSVLVYTTGRANQGYGSGENKLVATRRREKRSMEGKYSKENPNPSKTKKNVCTCRPNAMWKAMINRDLGNNDFSCSWFK